MINEATNATETNELCMLRPMVPPGICLVIQIQLICIGHYNAGVRLLFG
ncbi:Protein of unknown function [Pyronema omphalodes CBS 100304]|uniref:Uncharacterized protein n=1 Tax=Pyronema omphalodes (strain CBS 100304) TaxID=1076935 RepID=U4LIV4_PYROM|nr:Protein of unknown function [Pyronema omphalodes CBS 100304]